MSADQSSSDIQSARGFAALRHREFATFAFSKLLIFGAHHMLLVAVGYQIYDLTGDALALAYVNLVMVLPTFYFALFTGYVSDRVDRRTILVVGYAGMAAAAAVVWGFSVFGMVASGWIYVAFFINGTARAFFNPATNAIIPSLVPMDCFPNAITWNTVATKSAQIGGPALGGIIYLIGPEVVYITSAVFSVIGVLCVAGIAARPVEFSGKRIDLTELLAGIVFVYRKKILLGAIALDLIVILTASVHAVLPIIAKDILEVGPAGAGILRSAMASGGLLAALALTRFPIYNRAGLIMFMGDAVLTICAILSGLSTWFPLTLGAMVCLGAADMLSINIRLTLIQVATPNDMRGRVSAVSTVAGNSGYELGGFRAGLVAGLVGIVPSIVAGGLVGLVLVGLCWKAFPELTRVRRADRLP